MLTLISRGELKKIFVTEETFFTHQKAVRIQMSKFTHMVYQAKMGVYDQQTK